MTKLKLLVLIPALIAGSCADVGERYVSNVSYEVAGDSLMLETGEVFEVFENANHLIRYRGIIYFVNSNPGRTSVYSPSDSVFYSTRFSLAKLNESFFIQGGGFGTINFIMSLDQKNKYEFSEMSAHRSCLLLEKGVEEIYLDRDLNPVGEAAC